MPLDTYGFAGKVVSASMALRKGSGLGSYSTTSNTYVDIDTANLSYTIIVPTGSKMHISASIPADFSGQGVNTVANFAIADGTTTLIESHMSSVNATVENEIPVPLFYVFTGDGVSHTFRLRWLTGSGTITCANSGTMTPVMTFILMPSN